MNKNLPWEFEVKSLKASGSIFCRVSKKMSRKSRLKIFIWILAEKWTKCAQDFKSFSFFQMVNMLAVIKSHSKSSKSLWSQTASTNGEPCLIPYLPGAPNKSLWWTGNFPNDPKKTQKRKSNIQGVFLDKTWKVYFLVGNHLKREISRKWWKTTFPARKCVMTSSKIGVLSEFHFSLSFFIFWVSFQISIFKMIEKLFRTLETADDGVKNYENSKNWRKCDIQAPLQGPGDLYRPLNFWYT